MGAAASSAANDEPVDVGIGEGDRAEWPGLESMLCDHCNKAGSKLLRCSACRGAFFCSRECQQAAWPRHKLVCGHAKAGANTPSLPGSPASSAPGSPREPGAAKKVYRDGLTAFQQRRFREALKFADEAALLASSEGSMEQRCEALRLRGQCFEQLSDLTKAKETYAQNLTEARGNLTGPASTRAEANTLLRLGAVAKRSSKPGIAAQYQRKAVALLEADGSDKDTLAAAYNNLGISALQHGYEDEAQRAFEKAFKIRVETEHIEGVVACVSNLAALLRNKNKAAEACSKLEAARELAHEVGSKRLEQHVLLNLANLYENELPERADRNASIHAEQPKDINVIAQGSSDAPLPEDPPAPSPTTTAGIDGRSGDGDGVAPPSSDVATAAAAADTAGTAADTVTDGSGGASGDAANLLGGRGGDGRCEPDKGSHATCVLNPPIASAPSDASPSGKSEEASQKRREDEEEEKEKNDEGATATPSFPALALRCRRALFDLPEVPNRPNKSSSPELSCRKCRSDLKGCKQLRCSRCKKVLYCSEACQRQDWKEHSQDCKPPPGPSPEELELRDRTCPICLEPLGLLAESSADKKISILQCLHCLHTMCWNHYAQRGGAVCPVCRDNLGYSL